MDRRKCRILVVAGLALVGCACEGISTTIPPSSTVISPDAEPSVTESWTGTVPVGGAVFYSFSVSKRGTVQVTLQNVTGQGVDPEVTLGLAVGNPIGILCPATGVVTAQASSTPQLSVTYNAGVYCANVSDVGNLGGPATISVSIAHP